MFPMMMLSAITKKDIWAGKQITAGMRAYDVEETAKLWLKWGEEEGISLAADFKWVNPSANYSTCWKCLVNKFDVLRKDTDDEYVVEVACPACGVLQLIREKKEHVH
jgi:hypothetical protein